MTTDEMTSQASRPLVAWRPFDAAPPPVSVPTGSAADNRPLGAIVAFGIAAGWWYAAGPSIPFIGDSLFSPPASELEVLPTLIAATTGGFLLSPLAARARSVLDWVGVVVLLAVTTMVVGAAAVVVVGTAPSLLAEGMESLLGDLVVMVLLFLIGVIAVGPLVLPWLVPPAIAWAVAMRVIVAGGWSWTR